MGAINNRNDYRYFAALEDIKEIGAETPPMLHEDTPQPIGTVSEFPASASVGQWVVWNGPGDGGLVKGDIYAWDGQYWMHKAPDDASVQWMYMQSLPEILRIVPGEVGRFSAVITNLILAQEIIIGKTIKSANFNGTIDENGNITQLGTSGIAFTAAGDSCVNNGFFRGKLDCGVLKVNSTNINQVVLHYPNDALNASVFYQYLANKFRGLQPPAQKTVGDLYGQNYYVYLDDVTQYGSSAIIKAEYKTSGQVSYIAGFSINGVMLVYENNTPAGQPQTFTMFHDYKVRYIVQGVTALDLSGLPTQNPHGNGLAWNDAGTLRISNG